VPVIFVTAYDQYAMRAFDVHAVDYLLKPIGRERSMRRWKERKAGWARNAVRARTRGHGAAAATVSGTSGVKDGTKVTLIPVGKLDYAEAQDDYVALASQGKKHLKQQTIAGLEAASTLTASCASIALTS